MSTHSHFLPSYAELVRAGGEFLDFIKLEELREQGLVDEVKLHEHEEKVFLVKFVDKSKLLIVNGDVLII